jgi:hypothetical protein
MNERYDVFKDFNTKDWKVYDNVLDRYVCWCDSEKEAKEYVKNLTEINYTIHFPIWCFDREMIVVLKSSVADKESVEKLMSQFYSDWCDDIENVGDSCCEEYIAEMLKNEGVYFEWVQ